MTASATLTVTGTGNLVPGVLRGNLLLDNASELAPTIAAPRRTSPRGDGTTAHLPAVTTAPARGPHDGKSMPPGRRHGDGTMASSIRVRVPRMAGSGTATQRPSDGDVRAIIGPSGGRDGVTVDDIAATAGRPSPSFPNLAPITAVLVRASRSPIRLT
jgi:hypothetical protein